MKKGLILYIYIYHIRYIDEREMRFLHILYKVIDGSNRYQIGEFKISYKNESQFSSNDISIMISYIDK